ncbi:hypothetical protein Acr_28g0015190 [Actinidia rufa]|uniref:Uncharacterized protein n=1 Tax=Actinidia rufa TaxID=165716 RepID=A0A7J0HDM7_9ERIC|nr:hypothetical protein Acr_28g0015190 [Actinidia rufa]
MEEGGGGDVVVVAVVRSWHWRHRSDGGEVMATLALQWWWISVGGRGQLCNCVVMMVQPCSRER